MLIALPEAKEGKEKNKKNLFVRVIYDLYTTVMEKTSNWHSTLLV